MQLMRRRTARQTLIRLIIALTAIILLIIAGTILRMRETDAGFFEAMGGFLQGTFAGR